MESVEWKMESYDYQHLLHSWTMKVTMHLLARHGIHNFPFSTLHFTHYKAKFQLCRSIKICAPKGAHIPYNNISDASAITTVLKVSLSMTPM